MDASGLRADCAAHSPRSWRGQLRVGDDWAMWSGAVGDAVAHRHFAAQCVLAASAVAEFAGGHRIAAACLFIEPLAVHRLLPAAAATLVFLEPRNDAEHAVPAELRAQMQGYAASMERVASTGDFWRAWLAATPGAMRSDASDWRAEMRARIDSRLPEGNVPMAAIAAAAGLSSERFRHVFAERVGLSFRRFVLWRRLRCAVLATQEPGRNVTDAAHRAGFADVAHFSRTLKLTFGVTAGRSLLD